MLHIPWFVTVTATTIDGVTYQTDTRAPQKGRGPVQATVDTIAVPSGTRDIGLKWRWTEHPDLSYDRAVQLWLHKNYAAKPSDDTDHLFPTKTRPAVADPQTIFIDKYILRLVSRSGLGQVHFTLDGSDPAADSPRFTRPIKIDKSTTVRAIETYPDGSASDPIRVELTKVRMIEAQAISNLVPGANTTIRGRLRGDARFRQT